VQLGLLVQRVLLGLLGLLVQLALPALPGLMLLTERPNLIWRALAKMQMPIPHLQSRYRDCPKSLSAEKL
jgi:hypothetical protein